MADQQSNAALPALPEDAPRAGVLHVRHRHTDRFTVVGNHLAQHKSLSATAIGLAVHIQSLPDGASVTAKTLTLRFSEGETTIRKALNELENAGYLERRLVPLGSGRLATRTFSYEKPGCVAVVAERPAPDAPEAPEPPDAAEAPAPEPAAPPKPPTPASASPTASEVATTLLAGLRAVDARLILSVRDVQRLGPAVDGWLAREATPAQITRTLTANLPTVPLHHPARFLEHRLTMLLPPPLPTPGPAPMAVVPLRTCDGCERAFRSHDPDERCRDCRPADPVAA